MLVLHCDPRCDGDVVVSSPDVSPFSSSPLLMSSCGDRGDVAAAVLLPFENRMSKEVTTEVGERYARRCDVHPPCLLSSSWDVFLRDCKNVHHWCHRFCRALM